MIYLARKQKNLKQEDTTMTAYAIEYTVRGKETNYSILVDAKNLKSAKKKIGKKHGYKDGRMIQIHDVCICGYY